MISYSATVDSLPWNNMSACVSNFENEILCSSPELGMPCDVLPSLMDSALRHIRMFYMLLTE